jgi:hypothetical protein
MDARCCFRQRRCCWTSVAFSSSRPATSGPFHLRFVDVVGRCHELGFTDVVVNHPRRSGIFHGDPDTFAHAVQQALAVFGRGGS